MGGRFVEGEGPEQLQTGRARFSTGRRFWGGAQGETRTGRRQHTARADWASPQPWRARPDMSVVIALNTNIGQDLAWPHQPGRVPAWDGEPGPGAPTATVGV